jgi:hypothetical protein
MIKRTTAFLLLLLSNVYSFAQIGGKNSYEFLDLPVNAHVAGIGGINVSVKDQDVNLFMQNPALLNPEMNKRLSLSFQPYYADVKASSIAYAHKIKNATWGFGLQYFNYGKLDQTDATGTYLGSFIAQDFGLMASRSHTVNNFTLGVNLKFASSQINTYKSMAVMADLGGLFKHPSKDFTIGLVIKNAGFALKKFTTDTKTNLPFDVQVGTSYKPEHLPLRFSFTAHHLQKFNVVYQDSSQKTYDLNGNEIEQRISLGDKLGRHLIVGGELLLSKNFHILIGYNYLRRRELRLSGKSGGAGFSFGCMARVKSFELGFTRAYYHVAGGTTSLTVTTNFETLLKRKEKLN